MSTRRLRNEIGRRSNVTLECRLLCLTDHGSPRSRRRCSRIDPRARGKGSAPQAREPGKQPQPAAAEWRGNVGHGRGPRRRRGSHAMRRTGNRERLEDGGGHREGERGSRWGDGKIEEEE